MGKTSKTITMESKIWEKIEMISEHENRPISNYIETTIKSELDFGYSQDIARRISETRLILSRIGLRLPEDQHILKAFENLSVFAISNYPIPKSHADYINKNLKTDAGRSNKKMIESLKSKHENINEYFDIEIPLRGIESIFSWGKPDIELHDYIKLNYLIAKLYSLIGDKAKIMEE